MKILLMICAGLLAVLALGAIGSLLVQIVGMGGSDYEFGRLMGGIAAALLTTAGSIMLFKKALRP